MTTHTPGPWHLEPKAARGWWIQTEPGSCDYIALACRNDDEAVEDANARLIAAAPDMLAALRQAYLSLECRPELRRTAGIVAAAIAKAEGRADG